MPGNPGPGHSTYLASWGTSGICGSPRRFPQSHSSPPAWTAPGALCHTVRGRDEGERRVVLGIRHLLIPKNTGGWSPRNTSMQQCQVREETLSCPASELLQCLTVPLGCRGMGWINTLTLEPNGAPQVGSSQSSTPLCIPPLNSPHRIVKVPTIRTKIQTEG